MLLELEHRIYLRHSLISMSSFMHNYKEQCILLISMFIDCLAFARYSHLMTDL